MKKILITGNAPVHLLQNPKYDLCHIKKPESEKQIIKELHDSYYYIIGGPEYCSKDYIFNAKNLELIIVLGTGTSSFVDLNAAEKRNITVMNTPGINANTVANFALGSILMRTTRIHHSWKHMLEGGWYQKPYKEISEINIGFVGMGNINKSLVKILRNFNKKPMFYFSSSIKKTLHDKYLLFYCDLIYLFKKCDLVVISITYNSSSHHLINHKILLNANPELDLICFSSPYVISPSDLSKALAENKIRSAYMDGYYNEWLKNKGSENDEYELLNLEPEKFMATTHIAAQTKNAINALFRKAIENIKYFEEH